VLNEDLGYYIGLYDTWSSYKPETEGVFIAYTSVYGNTKKAVDMLQEKLEAKGIKVAVSDLAREDWAEAIEDAFRYDRMIVAAASYDGGVFPCMQDFLHHLQCKAYQKRKVAIVENGTWAPSAAKTMRGILDTMKDVEIVEPVVTIRSTMKECDMEQLEALADAMK
jgi:flavorubredoxin